MTKYIHNTYRGKHENIMVVNYTYYFEKNINNLSIEKQQQFFKNTNRNEVYVEERKESFWRIDIPTFNNKYWLFLLYLEIQ